MNAKLIGYTQPAEAAKLDGIETIQDLIAFCARVSNPSNQMNMETAERLLNYLVKHKHWSPFELASITMELETTRDIARQVLRHRSFTYQEFSQRYADPKDLGDTFVISDARLQDPVNRQNSIKVDDEMLDAMWEDKQRNVIKAAQEAYSWAIENGIAKEQARKVLPEGLTLSRLYMQGTVRSWIHYVELRSANGTQEEHMQLARALAAAIVEIFPAISDYCHEDA